MEQLPPHNEIGLEDEGNELPLLESIGLPLLEARIASRGSDVIAPKE